MASEAPQIRTIAIIGQGGVGKTSVADAIVFNAGANNRLGRVDDESSVFDTEPEEMKRRCTMTSSLHHVEWRKHRITLIDTPGQGNFVCDAAFALRGASGVVFVADPTAPLRAETAKVWSWVREAGLPCVAFINCLDRAEADVGGTVAALVAVGMKAKPVQIAIGAGESFEGVASALTGKAYVYGDQSGKFSTGDAPEGIAAELEERKGQITEDAAEGDDELLEKYLEAGGLSGAYVAGVRAAGVRSGTLVPVLLGSAEANIGVAQLLDAVVDLLPAPCELGAAEATDAKGEATKVEPDSGVPFSGLVFKTIIDQHAGQLSVLRVVSGTVSGDTQVLNSRSGAKERFGQLIKLEGKKHSQVSSATVGEVIAVAKLKATQTGDTLCDPKNPVVLSPLPEFHPVISFALQAKKRGEEDKAVQGLLRLAEEDRALHVERDEGSADILLSGSGQLHVEVACEKLVRKYGVEVVLKAPKVPYRETFRKAAKAHGRLKKQTGGHGQFADCRVEVEPLAHGKGFEFVNKIHGGAIPRGFIPAVEKGVVEAMQKGGIAGYPVVDVRVTLYDGQYHDVDSSEMAFKVAGSMAFKAAIDEAKPALLEPYVSLEVSIPDECMGDVMGDLNSRRAKVEGMEQSGENQVIRAKVPMAEVLRYAPDLTSITSGRGSFEMSFSHYAELPDHLIAKVVEEKRARDSGD